MNVIPYVHVRHFNVRRHETWTLDVTADHLGNPALFDQETGEPIQPAFDQYVCDNGVMEYSDWDSLNDEREELYLESEPSTPMLSKLWREAVANCTTYLGYDAWVQRIFAELRAEGKAAHEASQQADLVGALGIKSVDPKTPGAIVCGACGKAWMEDITPAGRCPWEGDHR